MATINVNDIKSTEIELSADSENFMDQLNHNELLAVVGGQGDGKILPLYNECGDLIGYVRQGGCN
jgi:hypothetical protein